jgi:uncharacterized protein
MANIQSASPAVKPIISYLKVPEDGEPYLEGWRCESCGETYIEPRGACSNCLARDRMKSVKLANSGKVYNWTIVHRNFPGVKVPFITAIVDLQGGGTVKGNLIGVEPIPEKISFDMPVNVVYRLVEQTDAEGNSYLSYFFVPANTDGANT